MKVEEQLKLARAALIHIVECDRAFGGICKEDRRKIEHLEDDSAMVSDCIWGLTGIETPSTPSTKSIMENLLIV